MKEEKKSDRNLCLYVCVGVSVCVKLLCVLFIIIIII